MRKLEKFYGVFSNDKTQKVPLETGDERPNETINLHGDDIEIRGGEAEIASGSDSPIKTSQIIKQEFEDERTRNINSKKGYAHRHIERFWKK